MQKFWALLVKTGHFEDDPGFKQVIHDISRKGMIAVGSLGAMSVAINFITNAIAGNMPAITYANPGNSIVIWDKLLLLFFSVTYIALSRSERGAAWARPVGVGMAIAATIAIILDDLGQNSAYVSHHYIGILMLLVVAAIPFQPRHAIAFDLITSATYVVVSAFVVSRFEVGGDLRADLFVYLIIVFFLVVGISTLLYHTRYDEYKAKKAAREAEEKVRLLEHAKSEFFANVSHEFRTPLTLIIGPVRDAIAGKYGELDALLENRLRIVDNNARQLQYLINELLDLASLEAGKLSLQIGPHKVDHVLKSIVASFASLAEENETELEYEIDYDTVEVSVDRHRLEQIVTNLLANAFKFTASGGRIRVSVGVKSETVSILIKDNGCGIKPDELPFIFDRFRKTNSTPGATGTGIGLALVKELVEIHKGRIEVTSDPGFGSEFIVHLQRGTKHLDHSLLNDDSGSQEYAAGYSIAQPDALRSVVMDELATSHKHSVLIVDDNKDMRTYLAEILCAHYNIEQAADGVEGLEKARQLIPDMIIADVMMPEMDGLEFCKQARADATLNHIPIILLTARASDAARQEGLLSRADDYMTKPFNSTELLIRAENLIELRQTLHHKYRRNIGVVPSSIDVPSEDESFLARTNEVIENEMSNSYFSVDHLADELGISRRQLERRLKQIVNISPAGYVRMMRLKRAAQYLEKNYGNVSMISQEVGFQDPNYFSKLFKQTFGVSPSQYNGESAE